MSASIFPVRTYRRTSASRLCFAQTSRVSLSIITSCMMTSCDYFFRRQRTSFNRTQPALRLERLPLGTAERCPGATYSSQNIRAHTVVAAVFQRTSRVAPPRQKMNADCLLFFGLASKLIYEEDACSSPRFRVRTDISVRIFSKKCKNFLRKFER